MIVLLRQRQISEMERARRAGFVRRVAERVTWPTDGSGSPLNPHSTIELFIGQGEKLGIVNEDDLFQYAQVRAFLGKRFGTPEFAWVDEYLGEWSSPKRRILNVVERLHFGTETIK